MGAHYKNGVPVPITRWEGSWSWQLQQDRERKKEEARKEAERYAPSHPSRHR